MKRTIIFILLLLGWGVSTLFSQRITPNEKFRALNIFINVIYDENPQYNSYYPDNENWLEATQEGVNNEAIPDYLLDLLDTVYNPNSTHGYMTRLYGESSFDSLQIIGDYVVVNVKESRIRDTYGSFNYLCIGRTAIDVININGLQTIYGHNSVEDYKYGNNNEIYFTQFFIRNINKDYGGLDCGHGFGGSCMYNKMIRIESDSIPISSKGTFQCVGVSNFASNPTSIVFHEFSHNLFGTNIYHTSGGNHRGSGGLMPFFSVQGGYGLMGAYGSSLVSCNGYERWRLEWKHSSTPYLISARDSLNLTNQNSDISQSDGVVTFILRDFVTTGDAIRIKLPYKDSEHASNQYIWLENHQVGKNSKVDFYQYSNTHSCRPQGLAGIYAYYQVGRDIRSGNGVNFNQTNERDNLKVIPAEGYWDYITIQDNYTHECVGSGSFEYSNVRYSENPFCGTHDQEDQFFPPTTDDTLKVNHIKEMWRKRMGESVNDSLPRLGDNLDAFHSYSKINMGTNPSTCNTKTFYNALMKDNTLYLGDANRNNQTTYLTGLSIEMIPLPDSTYRVNIRWDDYTVNNDAIWTGNICLKEFLYLNSGKTIHLKQNKTVALPHRNPETGYFANFTHFKCDSNSVFVLNNNSELKIDEKSIFEIDTLATFIVSDSSLLHITGGSSLCLKKGGDFKIYGTGTVIIDSLSTMIINDTIFASNLANIIVKPGGKLILDNGVITNLNNGEPWKGIRLEGNKNYGQNGAIAKQGTVIVKNYSTISNAICGIKVGDLSDTLVNGGIVFANNSTFKNCKNAIIFAPYKNMDGSLELANRSKFTNCNFIVNDNFYTSELVFDAHVKLFGVNGISFTGCSFTNTQTNPNQLTSRYASSGIFAMNSGFSVQPKCFSNVVSGEVCAIPYVDVPSIFSGLRYGIVIKNGGTMKQVKISSTQFTSNDIGVSVSGLHNVKLLNNDFVIGKSSSGFNSNSIGVYFEYASNFRIEENRFLNNANSNVNKVGLIIKNSGTDNNQVYKNSFSELTIGQTFIGQNYSPRMITDGLVSLCNSNSMNTQNDILVSKIASTDFNGINGYQGYIINTGSSLLAPIAAGNVFTLPNSIDMQYKNNANFLYYCYNPNNPNEVLTKYDTTTTISPEIAPENTCPSKISGLYPQIIDAELASITLDYANLRYNYNQLIDAGNTPEMLQLIQGEWSDDVWKLRNELIGQSPYLSQDAILMVAMENLLPPALLLEVCLANPDATKSEEFLDILRYEIPNPLPEYMINMIRASWENKTLRTEIEEELSAFKTYRDEYHNYKTELLLSDTIYNYTNIIDHLESRGSYSDYFSLAEIAISQNNFTQADIYLDILENSTEKFTEEEILEIASFREYISIRESIALNNKTIYNLDSLQIAALETYAYSNNYRGAILARNILCALYDICIDDIPAPPRSLRVGSNEGNNYDGIPFIASVKVMPNPASEYAAFIWDMKSFDKSSVLYVYDQNGKIIVTQPVHTQQGEWVWNVKNIPDGVYVYTFKSDQLVLFSGKLIINK